MVINDDSRYFDQWSKLEEKIFVERSRCLGACVLDWNECFYGHPTSRAEAMALPSHLAFRNVRWK
jgi:hypothetical protein